MARFKDKDLRLNTNEEVLLGNSQEASLTYDGSDLVSSLAIYASTVPSKDQHLTNKVFVDGEITDVRDYIDDVIKGLEWQDSVLSRTTDIPAGVYGERYIIPSGASGDWSGLDDDIAEYTTTWVYTTPSAGFATWVIDEAAYYIYSGSSWSRMGSVVDHGVLDGLADDDHTQYVLADGSRNITGTLQVVAVSAGTFEGPGYVHANLNDVHNLTTDINHNNITNTHNLSADIDHGLITNTHNLTTDISHLNINDLGSDTHTQYLLVDGTRGMSGTLTVSADILPGGGTLSIGSGGLPFDHIWCNTLHTSGGTVYIGDTRLYEIGGALYSDSAIIAPSGSDPDSLVTNAVLTAERGAYGFGHDHDTDYYTKTLLDGGQLNSLYYTETEIDTNFAPASHNNTNHSETYITAAGVTYGNLAGAGDVGTASTQVSQGDHSHAQLHDESHGNEDHTGTYIEAAGVTYENLDSAGDVGTASTQVAAGDHTHGGIGGVVAGIAVRGKFIYKDANEVYINAAAYHHAGTAEQLVYWDSQLTKAVTASTGWNYLYIDDSAVVTLGTNLLTATELLFSTTAPTWSDAKHGWYTGTDRCIFATYCTGANVQREFFSTGGGYVHFADDWAILASTDIDTTWIDVTCYPPFPGGTVQLTITNEINTIQNAITKWYIRVDGQSGATGNLVLISQFHTSFVPNLGENSIMIPTSVAANKIEIKTDLAGAAQVAIKQTGWYFPEGM